MAAGEEKASRGAAETLSTNSLDDSSLPVNFHGNLASARTDEELVALLQRAKTSKKPAIVTYGAPWCHACRHMLPTFCNLSNDYASALFIYADVDKCYETTQDVRYTQHSASTEMVRRWMSFMVLVLRDYETVSGCTLDYPISGTSASLG